MTATAPLGVTRVVLRQVAIACQTGGMSYGPLEFAAYLRRKGKREPAAVQAARAASAAPRAPENRLTIVSGPRGLTRISRDGQPEALTTASEAATPDVR